MAAKHNITLAIDGTLLKRARALMAEDVTYASAERVAAVLLRNGLPLDGARVTDRAALHDRHRVR